MNNLLEGVAGGSSGGGGGGYDWNDETNKSKVDFFVQTAVMFLPPYHFFTSNHPQKFEYFGLQLIFSGF